VADLLDEFNGWLEIETEVNERPLDAFALVFLLFQHEHRMIEQLLELLVGVVDTKLLKRVCLSTEHSSSRTFVLCHT